MISVFYTQKQAQSRAFLQKILRKFYGISQIEIAQTANGKPYLVENALKFNLSHSEKLTALALSEEEVGLDIQLRKEKAYCAILNRMTPAERQEDFFKLWTAKEAYVKLCGGTLAAMLSSLEYRGGTLFEHNIPVDARFTHTELAGCAVCVCSYRPQPITFTEI